MESAESKLDPSIMEQSVKYDNINPWIASSIFEFYYFCCPECDEKSKDKQDFVVSLFCRFSFLSYTVWLALTT